MNPINSNQVTSTPITSFQIESAAKTDVYFKRNVDQGHVGKADHIGHAQVGSTSTDPVLDTPPMQPSAEDIEQAAATVHSLSTDTAFFQIPNAPAYTAAMVSYLNSQQEFRVAHNTIGATNCNLIMKVADTEKGLKLKEAASYQSTALGSGITNVAIGVGGAVIQGYGAKTQMRGDNLARELNVHSETTTRLQNVADNLPGIHAQQGLTDALPNVGNAVNAAAGNAAAGAPPVNQAQNAALTARRQELATAETNLRTHRNALPREIAGGGQMGTLGATPTPQQVAQAHAADLAAEQQHAAGETYAGRNWHTAGMVVSGQIAQFASGAIDGSGRKDQTTAAANAGMQSTIREIFNSMWGNASREEQDDVANHGQGLQVFKQLTEMSSSTVSHIAQKM